MAQRLDQCLEESTNGKFQGLEDIESAYTYEQLKYKLKATDYKDIRQRLIDEFDNILAEFKES